MWLYRYVMMSREDGVKGHPGNDQMVLDARREQRVARCWLLDASTLRVSHSANRRVCADWQTLSESCFQFRTITVPSKCEGLPAEVRRRSRTAGELERRLVWIRPVNYCKLPGLSENCDPATNEHQRYHQSHTKVRASSHVGYTGMQWHSFCNTYNVRANAS